MKREEILEVYEAGPVSSNTLVIGRGNTGNKKLFVDINSTAGGVNDF